MLIDDLSPAQLTTALQALIQLGLVEIAAVEDHQHVTPVTYTPARA